MELPPLIQRLLTAAPAINDVMPVSIVTLDTRLAGTLLDAIIEQQMPLSEAQKQTLIKTLQAQLSVQSTSSHDDTPTLTKPPTDVFQTIQAKLYSAELNRSQNVEVMPKLDSLPNKVLLLTDVELGAGAKIQTKIREDGHLQLISDPSLTRQKPPSTVPSVTARQTPQALLQSGLRLYLPFKHDATAASKATNALWKSLNTLPMEQRNLIVDRPVWKALTNIVNHATLLPHAQHPSIQFSSEAIREQVMTSGNYLEPSLTKQISGKMTFDTSIEKDTKAQLLTLYSAVQARDPIQHQDKQSAPTSLQSVLKTAASQLRALESLLNTLGQLKQNTQPLNLLDMKRTIGQTLSAAAAIGVARISANQLQPLLNATETGNPSAAQQVELSLRIQDQMLPVSLYFQAFPDIGNKDQEYEKKDSEQKQKEVHNRWQIFIELELPEHGWFAAEVSLQQERVTTRLWSEREEIKHRARARLSALKETLEAQGLDVDDIRLENGAPPARQQTISQSLVDVRT